MKTDKELYRQLRALSREELWKNEVPRFDRAPPRERMERVAVIRAVAWPLRGRAPWSSGRRCGRG